MRRYGEQRDANEPQIIEALEAMGCSVEQLPGGKGRPDLLVGEPRYVSNLILEIKDGDKPPSKRKLNPRQVDWHANWKGQRAVVRSVAEAIMVLSDYWKSRGDSGARRGAHQVVQPRAEGCEADVLQPKPVARLGNVKRRKLHGRGAA